MATILYNQKSTYGGPYCFYTVQYAEIGRTATTATLRITVLANLQYAASYNGYVLNGTLTVGGTAFSIPLKGKETWSGTAVHTITKDIVVSASASTTSLSAAFAVSNPSTSSSVLSTTTCSNIGVSQYFTKASISATSGKIGDRIVISMSGRVPSNATSTVTYKFGSKTGTIISGTTAVSMAWDTASLKNQFLQEIPASASGTCTLTCTTSYGSISGSSSCNLTLSSGEKPQATAEVSPINTIPFLMEKGIYVEGYSQARVQTSATPGYASSMKAYNITGLDNTGNAADWTSDVISKAGSKTIKIVATDNRQATCELTKTIEVLSYSKPVVTLDVERGTLTNEQWTPSPTGLRLKLKGKVTLCLVDNSCALAVTLDDQPCEIEQTLINDQEFELILPGEVPIEVAHKIAAYVTDELNVRSNDTVFEISTEIVNMSMLPENRGVTLGGHPTEDGFVCEFPAKFYGGIYVDDKKGGFTETFANRYSEQGGIAELGKLLLDFTHPIGSYYWSADATNPATLFGGTWTAITGRFLMAASSTYGVGTTGGATSVALAAGHLPGHSHTVSGTAASAGTHRHSIGCDYDGAGGSVYATIHKSASTSPGYWAGATSSTGAHAHSVSGTASSSGAATAHENMPPYIVAYCWRRTA